MIDLKVGMKCYASSLSLHAKGTELKYKPPRGTKFAVLLMTHEKPDCQTGISPDVFLRNSGWELVEDQLCDEKETVHGWIACTDELPKESNEPDGGATGYLVLYEHGKEPNGGFNVGVWNVTYLRRWWSGCISHWMPLPKQPEE